jgi:Flp pilus assembly protein TadG
MLAALFTVLLALAGLVIDGGAKLDEAQNAAALAQEAARAGAGQVDQNAAHASGSFVVDQAAAVGAARQFLAAAGAQGTATPDGPAGIRVSVTLTEPTKVLSLIGISTISASGSATASLITGVTGAGR